MINLKKNKRLYVWWVQNQLELKIIGRKYNLLVNISFSKYDFYLAGYDVEGRRKKSQEVMTMRAVGM